MFSSSFSCGYPNPFVPFQGLHSYGIVCPNGSSFQLFCLTFRLKCHTRNVSCILGKKCLFQHLFITPITSTRWNFAHALITFFGFAWLWSLYDFWSDRPTVCLPGSVSIFKSVYLSVCLYLSVSMCQSVNLFVCLPVCLCLSDCLWLPRSISVCLPVAISICLSVSNCQSVCLPVTVSSCQSVCFMCLFCLPVWFYLSVCLSVFLQQFLSNMYLYLNVLKAQF